MFELHAPSRTLRLDHAVVMGVLNLTTDSFSDGGELLDGRRVDADALLARASAMVDAGAEILDLGAESTRPGAVGVAAAEEADRIGEALALLRPRFDVWLSVDSSTPEVLALAGEAGADLLNDVRSLGRPGALEAAARSGLPVCLMHMQGEPGTMQDAPCYGDVVTEVRRFLDQRIDRAVAAGIDRSRLLVDPGFGFGKTLAHNLALLDGLASACDVGLPILVGLSRKRMIGALTGREPGERMPGSIVAAALAVDRGAHIVRTHDVAPTVDALRVAERLAGQFAGQFEENATRVAQ